MAIGGYTLFSVDTGSLNLQVLSAGILDDSAGKPG
jgi:hypothetical protein